MLLNKILKNNISKVLTIFLVFFAILNWNAPVLGIDDELDQFQKFWNGGIGIGYPDMLAQSFKPTDNLLTRVELNMYKVQETQFNITVAIRSQLAGPDLTKKTLPSENISLSGEWIEFNFPDAQVDINETYFIVLIPQGPSMAYVWRGLDNSNFDNYNRGEAWLYTNGQWSNEDFLINDWAFKTYKAHYSHPPQTPTVPEGPITGLSWTSLYYQTSSVDPDGDDLQYGWDWDGDNVVDDWTGFYPSGTTINSSHCFLHAGIFLVQVKAQDTYGIESPFSNKLAVNITNDPPSKPKNPFGPNVTTTNEAAWFSTNSSDPDDHFIKYGWDWDGDDVVDEWTTFYPSAQVINCSHKWSFAGTYNVKVKAMDEYGAQSDFSKSKRIVVVSIENSPPEKPNRPIGKTLGWRGISYSYGTQTTDPNGDLIWYLWDWDDGTNSDWIGPFESGQNCNVSHTWETKGEFQVKVKAKDESGEESVWSDSLPISMPMNIPKILIMLFTFFEELLSNNL
jgi:hypothetical protein